jgi:hypothetical protein
MNTRRAATMPSSTRQGGAASFPPTITPQPATRPLGAVAREDRESGQSAARSCACGASSQTESTDQTKATLTELTESTGGDQ